MVDDIIKNSNASIYIAEKKFLEENMNTEVLVFLTSGVRLTGELLGYDDMCIILSQKAKEKGYHKTQMVYKDAIATINET